MNEATRPRILVLGGGFGGLEVVKALKRAPVDILLIDRTNHHVFQPLLYQVASAALAAPDISAPLRTIVRNQKNVSVLLAEVEGIDRAARTVTLKGGRQESYDYLVVATGAVTSYFGNDDWERDAPGLKTLSDALNIRTRLLRAFELAEQATDPDERDAYLTFVVVGGGPTGVEVAGAISEIARRTMVRDFRNINPAQARVILVDGAPNVLSTFPQSLSAKARLQLERLGVSVWSNKKVTGVDDSGVQMGDERIKAKTIVWAAGVRGTSLLATLGVALDRAGRVGVAEALCLSDDERVFVIGDAAAFPHDVQSVPGVAPAAIQMGKHTANNLMRQLKKQPLAKFRYKDRGNLATIGRSKAVADLGWAHFWGKPAWLLWLFVHVLFLVGFRNRLTVLFEWAWAYFTYQRSARIITEDAPPELLHQDSQPKA